MTFVKFLGAKAPLQPTSSEGLYVCLSVCMSMYVCNILTPSPPLPSPPLLSPPLEKRDKETKGQKDK